MAAWGNEFHSYLLVLILSLRPLVRETFTTR